MTDADTPTQTPSDHDAVPAPAVRPSQPTLGPRTVTDARPVRPSLDRAAASIDVEAGVIEAAPPPAPKRPATAPPRPSAFAAVGLRKTLIPPCLVLGVGCVALGVAYFRQPPDAALRQIAVAGPIAVLVVGGLAILCATALAWSVRRH